MPSLKVPASQEARQAVASLGGYAFQLYLSALEWAHLPFGGELLLEVAEDYSVLIDDTLTMTQAKSDGASGNVTLRSAGAVKAITSLWEFQEDNPGLDVRLVYLTTASAGREKGYGAAGDRGIEDWSAAAEGGGTTNLRPLLLTLDLPASLLDFLRTADDHSVRKRLLRPIRWACGSPSLAAVRGQLADRLVAKAVGVQLLAADGEAAVAPIVEHVLLTIVERRRRLTTADFERAFQNAAGIVVSRSAVRAGLLGRSGPPTRVDMAPRPSARLVPRTSIRDIAVEQLLEKDRIALVGLGGAGKTELAADMTRDARVRERYPDGVLWASIGAGGRVAAHLEGWITALGAVPPRTDDEEVLAAAWRNALGARRMLIVADDVWRLDQLSKLVAQDGCGLMVTGRKLRLASQIHAGLIEVGALEPEEALGLLERVAGSGALIRGDRNVPALADRLGRLPLALVLAGVLLGERRDAHSLLADLGREELRLSALDLDDGEGRDDDARRSSSMEACLGLSIRSLDETQRTAFYRLAILPEAASIDPTTAATILAVPDARAAARLLDSLASRGVLSVVSEDAGRSHRLHDLLLDYARTGFGDRRSQVAPVPAGLPDRLAELHDELLGRLISRSRTNRWTDTEDTPYFDLHLGWHMAMAERRDLLDALIGEADDLGQAAWLARARTKDRTSAFLTDLARALGAACADLAKAEEPGGRAAAMAAAAAACAAFAMMADKAGRTPAGLLPALVEANRMTVEEALTRASLVPGAFRSWLLAELLPHAGHPVRREIWREIVEAASSGDEFAMFGEDEFLDVLLPSLDEAELAETIATLPSLAPLVHAKVLAALHRTHPAESAAAAPALLARRLEGRDARARNAGIIHLAATGMADMPAVDELIGLLTDCGGFDSTAKEIFLLLDESSLAAALRNSDARAIAHVIEPFERFRRPLPLGVLVDAIGFAEQEADAAAAAAMMARLCALTDGHPPDTLVDATLARLLALPEHDWRRMDGLGSLLPATRGSRRRQVERAFVDCGLAAGFGRLGAMRLRVIAASLGREAMFEIVAVLRKGDPFDRQVTLPALLEHAPEDLVHLISRQIIEEGVRSGGVGDVHHAARRMSLDDLAELRDAVRLLPSPGLVAAIRELTPRGTPLPGTLRKWIDRSWDALQPDDRLRIAERCGFRPPADAAVRDVAACLLGRSGPPGDAAAALRIVPDLLARLDAAAVRRSVSTLIAPEIIGMPAHAIGAAASLSPWLGEEQAEILVNRAVSELEPLVAAGAISQLSEALPSRRRELIHQAVALVAAADPEAAARWVVSQGMSLDADAVAPLVALLATCPTDKQRLALSTALYHLLARHEQERLPEELIRRRTLEPSFIDLLDKGTFPPEMQVALDICRLAPSPESVTALHGALKDASGFLRADLVLTAHALEAMEPRDLALTCVDLLRSAMGTGVREFWAVMRGLAPSIRSKLGDAAAVAMAERVSDIVALYGDNGSTAVRVPASRAHRPYEGETSSDATR